MTEEESLRIARAEASAFEALYAAAASTLGTGTRRIGEAVALWHPSEDEAGFNYLMNFHLADDFDAVYDESLRLIGNAGASVFGVPIDDRVASWATRERISSLGLRYESDEFIWAREIDAVNPLHDLALPGGIEIGPCDLPGDQLARVINLGWDLEESDPRGRLYARCPRIPGWQTYLARSADRVAGFSVLCDYHGVGVLMLAVVMPEFRGRGLQSWFIAKRLQDAAARGCTLAISETNDDNASPRNLQRAGFRLNVARKVYSRPL